MGVTGDEAVATAAIRTVFTGNLCVVHSAQLSIDVAANTPEMQKLVDDMGWPAVEIRPFVRPEN